MLTGGNLGTGRCGIVASVALSYLALIASSALAGAINGGFEDGTFNGWTVDYAEYLGKNNQGVPQFGSWSTLPGTHPAAEVIDAIWTGFPGITLPIPPMYCGSYTALINDNGGCKDATRISQKQSGFAFGTIVVDWGAALEDGGHPANQQPVFRIEILDAGSPVVEFEEDASGASDPGNGWQSVGTGWWYKKGTFTYQIPPDAGAESYKDIEVRMTVTDCTEGGHGGFAFIDCVIIDDPCDLPCAAAIYQVIPQPLVPNAFTPNGDGLNDVWEIFLLFYASAVKVEIYDRWGLKLYEGTFTETLGFHLGQYITTWDGTYNGTLVQTDVYVYKITMGNCATICNNCPKVFIGSLNVVY